MNAAELNRLLLFHGQNDVTDFLRSSPLNRFLYKKLLGVLSASGIAVPAVKLFNDIYYQCARVNYDGMPGVDVGRRYWSEAAGWTAPRGVGTWTWPCDTGRNATRSSRRWRRCGKPMP